MSDSEVDERRLVERARAGDRNAAAELVEATYGMIFASLVRMTGNSDEAADLTQETYRKGWQSFGSFDGRSKFSTWLYKIAFTTFLNSRRGPRRLVDLDEARPDVLIDHAPGPDDAATRSEEDGLLREAVLALPEPLRYVVTAHYWGDVPVSELARHEQVTTVAIRKRLKKALATLERSLERIA